MIKMYMFELGFSEGRDDIRKVVTVWDKLSSTGGLASSCVYTCMALYLFMVGPFSELSIASSFAKMNSTTGKDAL